MSRIGRKEITVPAGVTVTIGEGNHIAVKGPKGNLEMNAHPDMLIKQEAG
ncbi:MAG: 50S ribosomal protein L6, partial [Oscillospiraceae bacterium]|nr:50S ribosomal protein L6 [Oscillospiraceae bacterium]